MRLFELKIKSGRIIYLSKERWNHIISEHPALVNKIEDIKATLESSLIIKDSKYDSNVKFYYCYYKDRKLYLMVVVKYLNGEGFVITSFYTDKIISSK